MDKKKKKILIIGGIIALLLIIVIAIVMNYNNDEKYLEVSKRTLPQMQTLILDTVEQSVELKQSALNIMRSYNCSQEQAINKVKDDNSYKFFTMEIDEKMSEMYKDLEYLKKHSYSKDKNLSSEIKEVLKKFETSIEEHKQLKVNSTYSNTDKDIYEDLQELKNKINRE